MSTAATDRSSNAVLTLPAGPETGYDTGEVYFIGNATTLIRFAGFTILTDPAFLHKGGHADLGHGIYARREVEPACQVGDLPPLDLIVLSHYHGDHFDDIAARDLDKTIPIISTSHYDDYSVFQSGLDDFQAAANASTADTAFHYLAHGETYTFTPRA